MTELSPLRSGGRAARRAARAKSLPAHLRPIRPGMEGGTYKPLSDADVQAIHTAALDALETIGLCDAPPSGVAYLTGAGAIQGEDGRIRFPRALVEDMLTRANREVVFPARDPKYVLIVTLDEPVETSGDKPRRTAGWTAVPVAAEIIGRIAPLLGLRPTVEPATLADITLTSSN